MASKRRFWNGKGFSPGQQPEWQAVKAAAWLAHCQREGLEKTLKVDRDWYEQELFAATGHDSTTDCDAGRDYDLAMAHFEVLAGVGIRWQMKLYDGDVKRMMHGLRQDCSDAALQAAKVDEAYLLGAIRRGFGDRKPWELERKELIIILGEVKRHVRRHLRHLEENLAEQQAALGMVWVDGALRMADGKTEVPEGVDGNPDWDV